MDIPEIVCEIMTYLFSELHILASVNMLWYHCASSYRNHPRLVALRLSYPRYRDLFLRRLQNHLETTSFLSLFYRSPNHLGNSASSDLDEKLSLQAQSWLDSYDWKEKDLNVLLLHHPGFDKNIYSLIHTPYQKLIYLGLLLHDSAHTIRESYQV